MISPSSIGNTSAQCESSHSSQLYQKVILVIVQKSGKFTSWGWWLKSHYSTGFEPLLSSGATSNLGVNFESLTREAKLGESSKSLKPIKSTWKPSKELNQKQEPHCDLVGGWTNPSEQNWILSSNRAEKKWLKPPVSDDKIDQPMPHDTFEMIHCEPDGRWLHDNPFLSSRNNVRRHDAIFIYPTIPTQEKLQKANYTYII